MHSCRRRSSTQGLGDSDEIGDRWKCDEQANEMRCDASSQSGGGGTASAGEDSCGSIARRRRQVEMRSCRRRSSTPGLSDSDDIGDRWKCDEQANEMRCDASSQSGGGGTAIVGEETCGSIARRRRQVEMRSCRRRFSTPGLWNSDGPSDRWKCDEQANEMRCDWTSESPAPARSEGDSGSIVGFPATGARQARGLWCEVDIPPSDWSLKRCPNIGNLLVKVLTYNLFWWNLFDQNGGGDQSAARLIQRTSRDASYDFMGFQECEDANRVLREAGLTEEYVSIDGGSAIAVAYRRSRWSLLSQGTEYVGEDSKNQYYGKRRAMWARLRHTTSGKTVFFINHHGPLSVSQGGGCTGSATSLNIVRVIAQNARESDVIILVGDFNAQLGSSRIEELNRRLSLVYSGTSIGGVDHVYSNCQSQASGRNLGKGDGSHKSDHDALSATFRI
jgi:endonuclease/exonuclease/phosphatase family metal-dependent hydrolase